MMQFWYEIEMHQVIHPLNASRSPEREAFSFFLGFVFFIMVAITPIYTH